MPTKKKVIILCTCQLCETLLLKKKKKLYGLTSSPSDRTKYTFSQKKKNKKQKKPNILL